MAYEKIRDEVKAKDEKLQFRELPGQPPEVTPDLESCINAIKSNGQPLSESECAFFESRFGYDFGKVRIHTDDPAAKTARALNARAFTVGRDIAFGTGQSMSLS